MGRTFFGIHFFGQKHGKNSGASKKDTVFGKSTNSILSHKGGKKIFFTHRQERVHKNDFKHE